jgi:hypothetical protein
MQCNGMIFPFSLLNYPYMQHQHLHNNAQQTVGGESIA